MGTENDALRRSETATFGPGGGLLTRPMTRQNSGFDGTVRLLVPRWGDLVSEIAANPQVNVSVQSSDGFVSVAGRAVVDDDRDAVAENWNAAVDAWFPEGRNRPPPSSSTPTRPSTGFQRFEHRPCRFVHPRGGVA
ncbi:pyridoxamine 5'-phosphate oxidase family protein [Rhodococcus sp. IEGM 1408]|uniref:pyridoxamine 5'-phosphate oxidase family protein n=1 Tax=Rhodococcus sp. IEGM 1408 TaxID=3082220 RepID=UPI00398A035B